MINNKD